MAIAGPAASVALGGVFYSLSALARLNSWPHDVTSVMTYLAAINVMLAVFNLIPAYPLDGGRVLRSMLWHLKSDLRWATRTAATIGAGFGVAMIVVGLVSVISGSLIGGLWWFLIGMFLRGAASMSYRQLITREALDLGLDAQGLRRRLGAVPEIEVVAAFRLMRFAFPAPLLAAADLALGAFLAQ